MFFIGSDMLGGNQDAATFCAQLRSDGGGKLYVKVYATSGMTAKWPYVVDFFYTTSGSCWLQPRALGTGGARGLVGIPSAAVASGCEGWVQVRGLVTDAAGPATSFTGSWGHAVYWGGATGIGATASGYFGLPYQIGVLAQGANSSTTADIFLVGNLCAQSI